MAKRVHNGTPRQLGFTITELLVVVIILGVLAAVVAPGIQSADPAKIDFAATKVAEAIRLARAEAMRTGETFGITIGQNSQRVRVRRYDITADPVDPLETLYHPVDKQLLDFDFDDLRDVGGTQITNSQDVFNYPGPGRRRTVLFDPHGTPIWITSAGANTSLLTEGIVELGLGDVRRTVTVAPYTGRVTIQ